MGNKNILAALAIVLASGSLAHAANQADAGSTAAAQAISQLVQAGYVKIDSSSGHLVLEKSLFEILKEHGLATESNHSEVMSAGCGSTAGDRTGSTVDTKE
jgi:DNA-binding IclR family transcriptional regulator